MEVPTCTYTKTLQATEYPKHAVAKSTPYPLGTLHLVTPVDLMQVDPLYTSLPLTLGCFTRQQLKPCEGRSRLPIQAVQIHIWTRFRRLPKERVLN